MAGHFSPSQQTGHTVGPRSLEAVGSGFTGAWSGLPIASATIVITSSAWLAAAELSGTRILTAGLGRPSECCLAQHLPVTPSVHSVDFEPGGKHVVGCASRIGRTGHRYEDG
jgi:hypothetical protein